jgi:hypothetical protein
MTGTDLVPHEGNAVARWAAVLVPAAQLAERIAGTEFVPKAMRGKPDVVVAAIMYGDEIGIGPMQALAGIHVVEGRPFPSAELLRAMILRDGHSLVVHEMTGTRCRISGLRRGSPESERVYVEWTADMARAAGLLSKDNWRKYPRAMLAARATADVARLVFPDVVKGLGHLADTTDDAAYLDTLGPADVEQVPEPKRTRKAPQRRTRPRTAAVTELPVAPPDEPPQAPRRVPYRPWGPDQPLPHPEPDGPAYEPEPAAIEPPPDANPRPEPRADAPPVEPPPKGPGDALRRALHAALGRVMGTRVERADRLALVGAIIGRELDTTNDLTRAEAMTTLDVLSAIQTGEATWQEDDDGNLEILDLRHPPPPTDEPPPPPPDEAAHDG